MNSLSYSEFLLSSPGKRVSTVLSLTNGKVIFDYLIKPINITSMIISTKNGLPALEGCIKGVEKLESAAKMDFNNNHHKQIIGLMASYIMNCFGYFKLFDETDKFNKSLNLQYFKTASIYSKFDEQKRTYDININIVAVTK
ncbi:hypothetical protein [Megasphaera sueciensis]|jgi:hypothetical protein|uniref:hypothetical protein n=1 Tax=Megasphaera sueciensis TaxID=349094 RepID=UPI003D036B2B